MPDILSSVARKLPAAADFFSGRAQMTLAELSLDLNRPGPPPSPAISRIIINRSRELLTGAQLAALEGKLGRGTPFLTANHHGLDTHPENVQGIILAALATQAPEPVVILACTNVPLCNASRPGGLILGRRGPDGSRLARQISPRSLDNCVVGLAPPLTRKQIEDFAHRLSEFELLGFERRVLTQWLEGFFLTPECLDLPDLITQAARFNQGLWRVFFEKNGGPAVIYLDAEAVATDCLLADLGQSGTPVARALLEKETRQRIVDTLSGLAGCWGAPLAAGAQSPKQLATTSQALGTVFFWEIGPKGQRYSMQLRQDSRGARLEGPSLSLELAPEALAAALTSRAVSPGLFLFYLVLSHHQVTPTGGVFMIDYLPKFIRPAAEILEQPRLTAILREELLACGPLPLRLLRNEELTADDDWPALISVGAVELAAAEPGPRHWRELAALRLADIWPFTASEWFLENVPPPFRPTGWRGQLPLLRRQGSGLNLQPLPV
ncbi:MAG: hypothetical protein LBP55_05540 [Candidatus Adiutrix sp.]|jgi:hypothetical protein|nr:hypothetical protein [Candidatus Adiutrix sp.]